MPWPLVVYFVVVMALAAALLIVSALLGERRPPASTVLPYESGIVPASPARIRFGVSFYLLAALFVVFDLEAAYLFAWAVVLRQLGWAGYASGLVFIGILGIALVYLWRIGALDVGPRREG